MADTVAGRLRLRFRARVPVILQTEAAECGLACLAMIAAFHGHEVGLDVLRRQHSISLKGSTLASLMATAQSIGLGARPVTLALKDVRRLRLPCVLHWQFDHFVVLTAVTAAGATIHDPATGCRRLSCREVSHAFTGVALELQPSAQFRVRRRDPPVLVRDVLGHVHGLGGPLCVVLSMAAAVEVFAAAAPLLLQWVVDHALLNADRELLVTLVLGFGLLMVLQQVTTALRAWAIVQLSSTFLVQWQANVFDHLLRLPVPWFEKRHIGDIVSRFRATDAIKQTLGTAFIEALVDGVMTSVVMVVVYVYSPLLATVCVTAIVAYMAVRAVGYRPLHRAVEDRIAHSARQDSHFLETVRGVRAIKLFGRQQGRRAAWLALLVAQVNAGLKAQRLHIVFNFLNNLVFGLEHVLVVWLGAQLVLEGEFSVGMLMAFMAYKTQLSTRVSALIDKCFELKVLRVQAERLGDIVLTPQESGAPARRVRADAATVGLAPPVRVRGLRFRYAEHERYILDGVNFDIAPGESVVVVGGSGCGKSTLLHLILGVLPATAGTIDIAGRQVSAGCAWTGAPRVGSVTQGDTLFAGSVADNISFFDDRPDHGRITACAELASISDDIEVMPMGYNSLVGYCGSALSAGQQQRILLARALYRQPAVLVLDEATSHLDLACEARVNDAIRSLRMTRIIVAHRPQTAHTADRVVILEQGRIRSSKALPAPEALLASAGC